MIVEFSTIATATLREHWRAEDVPDGLSGDELTEWLENAIRSGEGLEFLDQDVDDERDRELSEAEPEIITDEGS